tara:strand:+ start:9036 stop:9272 length:237 start_codon:yes stop_codon:yes gene_type:complete
MFSILLSLSKKRRRIKENDWHSIANHIEMRCLEEISQMELHKNIIKRINLLESNTLDILRISLVKIITKIVLNNSTEK